MPPPIPPAITELLPGFDEPETVLRDADAAAFVAGFAVEDSDMAAANGDDEPNAMAFLSALAGFAGPAPQQLIDIVAVMTIYADRDAAQIAAGMLERLGGTPSPSIEGIGRGRLTGATWYGDIYAESEQYVFDIAYPDGSIGALGVNIDTVLGGFVRDLIVFKSAEEFAQLASADGQMATQPSPLTEAASRVRDALEVGDTTIELQVAISEDARLLRPMLDVLLAPIDHVAAQEREPVTVEEYFDLDRRFAGWLDANRPGLNPDSLMWIPAVLEFAGGRLGKDPRVWGPNTAIMFLEVASRLPTIDKADMLLLPDLLRDYVRWAHQDLGWGEQHLGPVLKAIDDAEPRFEREVATAPDDFAGMIENLLSDVEPGSDEEAQLINILGRAGVDIEAGPPVIDPVDGSHPEPFDSTGLGSARDRAVEIAEHASGEAARLFDDEFVTLVRRLIADAARADSKLFCRGRVDLWVSGAIYAVAQLTNIVGQGDSSVQIYAEDLTQELAGAHSTIVNKARTIREAVGEELWGFNPWYRHSATLTEFDFGGPFDFDFDDEPSDFGGPLGGLGPAGVDVDDFDEADLAPVVPLFGARGSATTPAGRGGVAAIGSLVLRCDLVHTNVSRTVRVPAGRPLKVLHQVLQQAFGWFDCHLYEFDIEGVRYTTPDSMLLADDPDIGSDLDLTIGQAVGRGAITYVYDFGDWWQVDITVIDSTDEVVSPAFELVEGVGDGPPEDCGGPWGYENLLAALADPAHPDHEDLTDWAGDFRPGSFNLTRAAVTFRSAFPNDT